MSLHDFLVPSQDRMIQIDAEFGNSIAPFRPSMLSIVAIGNTSLKLMKKIVKLSFGQIRFAESLFKHLISDSFK
jgi:hypothetical protein